jgi:EAL domain-containing protein (putative c-di-GMP-specific phosphodiesterase class I)
VNLSASSLQDRNFRAELRNLLRHNAQSARRLWLEVSESGALKHFEANSATCAVN